RGKLVTGVQTCALPIYPSAFGTSGAFQFTDADSTAIFKCKLDTAATYTACSSGSVSTDLSSGSHSFSVKAYDSTGTYVSTSDARSEERRVGKECRSQGG